MTTHTEHNKTGGDALEEFDRFCRFIDGMHMGGFVENDFMCKAVQQKIRAALSPRTEDGWRDIGTAPRDGVFLIYTESKMWYVAVPTARDYDLKHIYPFHTYTNCHPIRDATHWMPLPQPPKDATP